MFLYVLVVLYIQNVPIHNSHSNHNNDKDYTKPNYNNDLFHHNTKDNANLLNPYIHNIRHTKDYTMDHTKPNCYPNKVRKHRQNHRTMDHNNHKNGVYDVSYDNLHRYHMLFYCVQQIQCQDTLNRDKYHILYA